MDGEAGQAEQTEEAGATAPGDALFRTFADNIPILAWIAAPDGYIRWYNRRWHAYCGSTPAQMEGWGWQSVHDPAKLADVMAKWTVCIESGEPFEMTFPLLGADGVFRPFLTRAEPIRDESGHVLHWFGTNTDVSEQLAAEQALQRATRAAELLGAEKAAILGQLGEGVIVTGEDGRISFVNEAAERLHGVARLDVAPDEYSDTYHLFTEDGRPYPTAQLPLARAVRGETVTDARWRIRRPDGSEVLAIGSARPLMEGARQVGAVLTIRDDTEREAAEREVRENEARLRALTDNLPGGMVYQITTGDGGERRFTYVSQSHDKLTGVPAEEVLADARVAYEMIVPEDRGLVAEAEARAIAECKPFDVEVRCRRRDGEVRWMRMISAPREQADGSLIWDGVQLDISGRRKAEEALRRSEARYRQIVEGAEEFAIVTVDDSGVLTSWNSGAERMIGYSESEAVGQSGAIFFSKEDRAAGVPDHEMNRAQSDGRVVNERWHERKGGSRFWGSGLMMRLEGEGGGYLKIFRDRTAEHEAEAAMRESEERFRNLADNAPVMVWVTDANGACSFLSRSWYEFTGQTEEEGLGFGWLDAVHPDDRGWSGEVFRTANEKGERFQLEYRLRAADGNYRWAIDAAAPRFGLQGDFLGYVGSVVDIDDRKRAEQALRESEERYRSLFNSIDAGFCIIDNVFDAEDRAVDYRFVEVNPAFERQTGLTDVVGKSMLALAPAHEQHWFDIYGKVARTGEAIQFENRAEALDRWFDVHAFRISEGGTSRVAVLFNDITPAKRAEAALRESEARFQAIANSIDQMIWSTQPDGFHDYFNQRWYDYTGVPQGSTDGEAWNGMFHPADQERAWGVWAHSLATGEPYHIEYRLRHRSGEYRWVLGRAQPVRDEAGEITRWFGTCTDIQEIVEAREVLARSREELEQLVEDRTDELMQAQDALRQSQKMEAIGQLTGGVAHDFNNLLTVIRGSADLLRRQELSEERRRKYIDAIADTADRAAKLTGQLLAFARRQSLKPEIFDVGHRVRSIAEIMTTIVGARVEILLDLGEGCFVEADANQFETALLNLAVNARDAMDGEGRLTVAVLDACPPPVAAAGSAPAPDYVCVQLADTGRGIPKEKIGQIFEPFFTTKEVGKGTGLGLSQVYGFVKQSGGEVQVDSAPGEGATFTLFLPRSRAPAAEGAAKQAGSEAREHRGCVLVVEDNEQVGEFSTELLRELGYDTVWAANAEAALARLAEKPEHFDLVFSDVVMPGMSGLELGAEIRRLHPDLPVVLTSGYSHVLAQDGAHGFELLRKPYSLEDLAATLAQAISAGR